MDLTMSCITDGQKNESDTVQSLQGTLQRVNYQRREVTVVAQGKVWRFTLRHDCQLWFNDARSILRCFHPLDPVTVHFDAEQLVLALYSWEANAA